MANPTVAGVSINLTLGDVSINLSGSFKHQSVDHSTGGDFNSEKDQLGNTMMFAWTDTGAEEADFESIPIDTTSGSFSAAVQKIPKGTKFTVTSTTQAPELAGTNWFVNDWSSKRDISGKAARVKIKAIRNSNIT